MLGSETKYSQINYAKFIKDALIMENKFRLKSIIIIILFNIVTNVYSQSASEEYDNLCFYFGVSGFYSNLHFKENYGHNMFAKSFKGAGGFFVYMFNNSLGLEFGYPIEKSQRARSSIDTNQYIAGKMLNIAWNNGYLYSEVKQKHAYVGLMLSSDINERLAIATLLGVAAYNIHAKYNISKPSLLLDQTFTFTKTKRIPIARLSLEYKIDNRYVIRLFTTWKNTNKVYITSEQNVTNIIKLRDSFTSGIGIACGVV